MNRKLFPSSGTIAPGKSGSCSGVGEARRNLLNEQIRSYKYIPGIFPQRDQAWAKHNMVVAFGVLRVLRLSREQILQSLMLSHLGKRFTVHHPSSRKDSRLQQGDPLFRDPIQVSVSSQCVLEKR
jgi:hypothetical protein